ncbi:redoxin family protein [Tundrisphaera lichenicola]|uniref:redoxin family protein n=1 Tax=Tundrisphaera lichenicola TaxID=2029860 RepID=UPI003EBF34B0
MRLALRSMPWLLLLTLAGCSSTVGSRFGAAPGSRSIAMVGDSPMPATAGQPGSQVAADVVEPEPRRSSRTRISGRVLDQDGRPAQGVTVRLADGGAKGGRDIQSTTDRSGGFTLNGLRPGSIYDIVAESDDDRGMLTGRAEAETAETGIEITLARAGKSTPSSNRSGRASRAKPISNRGDEFSPIDEEEIAPALNREDLGPPAEEAEVSPDPRSSRPRLSAPEPTVGWRKSSTDEKVSSRSSRSDRVASSGTDEDEIESRSSRPSTVEPALDDESLNPLPPAINRSRAAKTAREDQYESDEDREPSTRRNSGRDRSANDPEAGSLSLAPEASNRSERLDEPGVDRVVGAVDLTNPPPLPSLASDPSDQPRSLEFAGESTLEPGSIPNPGTTGQPALAIADESSLEPPPTSRAGPPPADTSPPLPSLAADTLDSPLHNPASRPVFASTEKAPEPASASAKDYNPFLLVSASPAVVSPRAEVKTESQPAASPAPEPRIPPRKKWGEVAKIGSPTPANEPNRSPNSLIKRLRGNSDRKDVTLSLCNYDASLPKLIDFQLPDLEGKPVHFQDLDADFILLDFWGTWWEPCVQSIPHLIELQKQYGPRRLRVVGIACEKVPPEQRKARVEEVARRLGINYAVLISGLDGKPCPVQQSFQVQAYPTSILLDRSGRVLWRNVGATPATSDRLDRVLAGLSRTETVRR